MINYLLEGFYFGLPIGIILSCIVVSIKIIKGTKITSNKTLKSFELEQEGMKTK